jgi:hypothetical protein
MEDRKNLNLVLNIVSPLLPVLAILIFRHLGQALELLVACIIIFVVVLWSLIAFMRARGGSVAIKAVGAILGIVGLIITTLVGIISGLTLVKV